jgi:RNA polymerase-associated protein
VLTLYDALRCPFAARVRIVLAEKGVHHTTVPISLDDRPSWMYEKNPPDGLVPVLEDEGEALHLVESHAIMEYLEERFPKPSLLPVDLRERAQVRAAIQQSTRLGSASYDLYRNHPGASRDRLEAELNALNEILKGMPYAACSTYTLADVAYVVVVLRAERRLGVDIGRYGEVNAWLERLRKREAIAAEVDVVAGLPAPAASPDVRKEVAR